MDKLRYGIISASSIAPRFIAAVRESNSGDIIAISSRTEDKAKQKAIEWNIPKYYGDYTSLLKDEDINIVYISSVNSMHYSMAKEALEHGKHVVCEKPCTTNSSHTKELFELAEKKGLFFMEAQKMLFLPCINDIAKDIETAELGDVTMVELSHSFPGTYNDWMYNKELGGGPLLSSGIYAIQFILKLFGSIDRISIEKSSQPNGVEWQYIISGTTKGGVLFSIKNSTKSVLDNTARIFGSRGFIEIPEYWKAKKIVYHLSGKTPFIKEYPYKYEMVYEAQHIKNCIEKGMTVSDVVDKDITLEGIRCLERIMNV